MVLGACVIFLLGGVAGWMLGRSNVQVPGLSKLTGSKSPSPTAAAKGKKPPAKPARAGKAEAPDRDDVSQKPLPDISRLKGPAKARQQLKGCLTNLSRISLALATYARGHDHQVPRKLKELVPKYIPKLPVCPAARKDTYLATYKTDKDLEGYKLFCEGHFHAKMGVPKNAPVLADGRVRLK